MSDIYKLLTVFLLAFLTYNCGIMQQEEHYPLDAGMSWEYNTTIMYPILFGGNINTVMKVVNFPKRTFEQGEVVPRKYTLKNPESPGEVIFFEFIGIDEEGMFIYAEQSSNIPELQVLGYRNYFIKHSLKVGDNWQCNHESHNSRSSLVSMETITVPAGNFDNCLKIKVEGIRELKEDDTFWRLTMMGNEGPAKIRFESIYWYAPGVGTVKFYESEQIIKSGRRDRLGLGNLFGNIKVEMQSELTSYKRGRRQTLKKIPLIGEKQKEKFAINEGYITPEVLGKNVLQALRKRDIDHFMNFVVKQKYLEELIEVVPQHSKRQIKDGIQKLPEILESIRKTFLSTSERGIENRIKWELTKFESVKYNVDKDNEIEEADIYMIFSYKGICYKIQIDDCIKTKRGWLNTDGISWSGKEENSTSQRGEVTAVEPKTMTAQPRFRSQPTILSQEEVITMLKKNDFFGYFNKEGHGFANKFEVQTLKGDTVVLDHAAGLMWQQGGSPDTINFVQAKQFIEKLNRRLYAGYNNWRLPTSEEVMSLAEREKKNGDLCIDPVFDKKQQIIWTSDLVQGKTKSYAFVVGFADYPGCGQKNFNNEYYVRAVRFAQSSNITAAKKNPILPSRLRSQPASLSSDEVKAMIKKCDFFDIRWNKKGNLLPNQFKIQTLRGDKVVLDHTAGLMWQQGGSEYTTFEEAKRWMEKLNSNGCAGFHDWRLPTLEEAMSLMERDRKSYLYINNVFDKKQIRIWTSDLVKGASWPWVVYFNFGRHGQDAFCTKYFVRAVRSVHAQ